jgi:hypothetical protein
MIKKRERKKLDNRPSISGLFAPEFPPDAAQSRPFPTAPLDSVRKTRAGGMGEI